MEQCVRRGIRRHFHVVILDKISKMAVLLLTDRRLQGHRILGDLHDLSHAVYRHIELFRKLLRRCLSSEFLYQLALCSHKPVDRLDHMDRDPDRSRLVRDRAGDRLTYPPGRVSAELVSLPVIKLFHGLDESEISLLDQVQKLHPASHIALCDADHKT